MKECIPERRLPRQEIQAGGGVGGGGGDGGEEGNDEPARQNGGKQACSCSGTILFQRLRRTALIKMFYAPTLITVTNTI